MNHDSRIVNDQASFGHPNNINEAPSREPTAIPLRAPTVGLQRACQPCRNAKVRCDRARPVCGRCMKRGICCNGERAGVNFVFVNQNEKARLNSQRARGQPYPLMPAVSNGLHSYVDLRPLSLSSFAWGEDDEANQDLYWLKREALQDMPEPVRRDLDTRAIERFFVNWVIHPCNHGVTPGHLQDLPAFYYGAESESVVRSAVHALAYAELGEKRDGNGRSFRIRAQAAYGKALAQMRTVVADEQQVSNDRVLVALLLVDNFEMMHLGRSEPLGAHGDIVRHILTSRGNEQLYSSHSFALWRIAHHRLQARQMMLRQGPDNMQELWMMKLDTGRPDIHISADVLHMNILSAAVRRLIESGDFASLKWREQAIDLTSSISDFLDSTETWTAHLSPRWKSTEIDRSALVPPRSITADEASFLLPSAGPIRTFHDKWLAYMWNFHMASRIILRESLIELCQSSQINAQRPSDVGRGGNAELIAAQRFHIRRHAETIVSILPSLLGFTDNPHEEALPPQIGNMAGRYFCFYSIWVVQRARYTLDEERDLAGRVEQWIKRKHGLV